MSEEVTIKVGDQVRDNDGDVGTVLATIGDRAWVDLDDYGDFVYAFDNLVVIPPAPEPVAWRNVHYGQVIGDFRTREDADVFASPDRLGVIIKYSDGSRKLEVLS